MKKIVGDLRLLELNMELVIFKGSKLHEVDLKYVEGKLLAKYVLKKDKMEIERRVDIKEIQEMTVKEFHDYLIGY